MGRTDGATPLRHAAHSPPPNAGEEFSGAAARLAGVAGMLFGWSPDAFWAATPAELGTLVRALGGDGEAGVDRAAIDRLQEMFPDG